MWPYYQNPHPLTCRCRIPKDMASPCQVRGSQKASSRDTRPILSSTRDEESWIFRAVKCQTRSVCCLPCMKWSKMMIAGYVLSLCSPPFPPSQSPPLFCIMLLVVQVVLPFTPPRHRHPHRPPVPGSELLGQPVWGGFPVTFPPFPFSLTLREGKGEKSKVHSFPHYRLVVQPYGPPGMTHASRYPLRHPGQAVSFAPQGLKSGLEA